MPGATVTHHEFPSGVHVELIIDDGNGDVTVQSVEFESVSEADHAVAPRQVLPDTYEDEIVAHLEDAGFTVRETRPPA